MTGGSHDGGGEDATGFDRRHPERPDVHAFGSRAQQRRIVAAAAIATSAGVLPAFLVGSQAVQIRADLHFGDSELGAAIAISWASAALASTPMGRVAEALGGGRSLRAAALANAAVMVAIALFADTWWELAAFVAIGGVGNALAQPSANLLTARTIPADKQGFAFGVKQSAVPFATLLGGLAVPAITLTLGWRAAFGAGALFALAASLLVVRGDERGAPRSPPGRRSARAIEEGSVAPGPAAVPARAGQVLRHQIRPLLVLAAAVGMGAAAAGGLSTFLVSGSVAAGVEPGRAGLLLTMGSAVGIAVRLLMGRRADRAGRDHLLAVALMMTIGTIAFVTLGSQSPGAYLLATPFAFGAGWAWPGLFNLSVVQAYAHAPGGATGITQTGTYLGAGLGPLVFGIAVEQVGWTWAWALSATWLLAGACLMVAGRRSLAANQGAAAGR